MKVLLLSLCCLVVAVSSQGERNEMMCQPFRSYCNPSGFPSCCLGLVCRNDKCDTISGGGGNIGCATEDQSCDRKSCCPGTRCDSTIRGRVCRRLDDNGGIGGNCASRGESCDFRNCCLGLRCQSLGSQRVCRD